MDPTNTFKKRYYNYKIIYFIKEFNSNNLI